MSYCDNSDNFDKHVNIIIGLIAKHDLATNDCYDCDTVDSSYSPFRRSVCHFRELLRKLFLLAYKDRQPSLW